MITSNTKKFVFLLLLIAGTSIFWARQSFLSSHLSKNHTVVCANIVGATAGRNFSITIAFEYHGNKYAYNHSVSRPIYENYKSGISTILVAIEKDNPKNYQILSSNEEYTSLLISKNDTTNIRCN